MTLARFFALRAWWALGMAITGSMHRSGFPGWSINLVAQVMLLNPTVRAMYRLGWSWRP